MYDGRIRGLAVRVSPMGTKAFVVWYRIGTKARRLTLGRFPTMSLAEARKRAQEALLQVADGKDPAAEKQRARSDYGGNLFSALVDEFIETYAKRKTRGWRETEQVAQARVRQRLGKVAHPDHLTTRRDQGAERDRQSRLS